MEDKDNEDPFPFGQKTFLKPPENVIVDGEKFKCPNHLNCTFGLVEET